MAENDASVGRITDIVYLDELCIKSALQAAKYYACHSLFLYEAQLSIAKNPF